MNNKPLCITFAGVVGSSKTPIANFLSCQLGLPIFNNDAIRSEVIEDLGSYDKEIHHEKRNKIMEDLFESKRSFICDASQDREWFKFKEKLLAHDYDWFIISLDLSKEKLVEMYNNKKYSESLLRLDKLMSEHDKFVAENKSDINLTINDANFNQRQELSYLAVKNLVKN